MYSHSSNGLIYDQSILRGDYLSPAPTDPMVLTNAYFYYATSLMAKVAKILGENSDANYFNRISVIIRNAFNDKLFDKLSGIYGRGDQSSLVLPLAFEIVPENLKQKVANNLADSLKANGYRLKTGFFGTAYLLSVLCNNGHYETAYNLACGKNYPSWGHQIESGSTTFWERWNSSTERLDGMNSYNHVGYGIGDGFLDTWPEFNPSIVFRVLKIFW
ncbi:MAG: hypothetical protein HC906_03735 [Bacteroidales bacterium]|nr:hypothetical protein [Bacteroidales bacterium]